MIQTLLAHAVQRELRALDARFAERKQQSELAMFAGCQSRYAQRTEQQGGTNRYCLFQHSHLPLSLSPAAPENPQKQHEHHNKEYRRRRRQHDILHQPKGI